MALPVFQIGKLKLKITQRLGVSLLFLFGTLTCIASICLVVGVCAKPRHDSAQHLKRKYGVANFVPLESDQSCGLQPQDD